eukprot:NODE_169_length_14535_cov_0.769881.p10 type:complete len:109 gc:universal NODE_169_length_14535_cov_0.769881:11084-11410(+)
MDTMNSGNLLPKDVENIMAQEKSGNGMSLFLEKIDLVKYQKIFQDQEIDLRLLLTLADDDLQQLGIKAFGPRRKIINAISVIRESLGQNTTTDSQFSAVASKKSLLQE